MLRLLYNYIAYSRYFDIEIIVEQRYNFTFLYENKLIKILVLLFYDSVC